MNKSKFFVQIFRVSFEQGLVLNKVSCELIRPGRGILGKSAQA